MVLKFGIQEKTALLVMLVAVAAVVGTSLWLQSISARMIEKHELVDLDDEANLRAWELIDRINRLRDDVREAANDRGIRNRLYKMGRREEDQVALRHRLSEVCKEWDDYLSVEIFDVESNRVFPPLVERIRGVDSAQLVAELQSEQHDTGRNHVLISKIRRAQVSLAVAQDWGEEIWVPKWMALVWGAVRVQPPPDWTGPDRYLLIAVDIEPPSSPRHLFFLVDADSPDLRFVIHPNMSIEKGLGEDGMFEVNLLEQFEKGRDVGVGNPDVRIHRVGLLEGQPLADAYHFYFREGQPVPDLKARLDQKRSENPELFDEFMHTLSGQHETMARRLGGLGKRVEEIRLLAREPEELQVLPGEEMSFREEVEESLREFTNFPERRKLIHWKAIVPCRHCHISFLEFPIETARGPRSYLMLYAAFQEEFVGSIQQEIRSKLVWWVVVFGILANVVAFVAALFFVRPLQRMTKTAQHVVAEQGPLHERIADLSANLPIERRDEVGDIARASRRLFDVVISSQEQLEQRVRERTRELEEANRKLEGVAKEKDAFLANVSHELRTPLTAVSGFLQLLKRRKLPEKESNYATKALQASGYLESLIDDILDFQKIVMGGVTLDPSEFEVSDLLEELEVALQFQAKKFNNKLECRTVNDIGTIEADRQRLRQVLTNIISNACKFTRQGEVRVEAEAFDSKDTPWVRFRISDTGRGMSEEERGKLFTRFMTSKKANESGTGLGLVICEGLCGLMGGRIYLERSEPGKGTVFAIEIPKTPPGEST